MSFSSLSDEPPPCPFCDTASCYLGALGRRSWWRCPGCGLDHDVEVDDDPPAGDSWDMCDEW
jgi:hypothetical protein